MCSRSIYQPQMLWRKIISSFVTLINWKLFSIDEKNICIQNSNVHLSSHRKRRPRKVETKIRSSVHFDFNCCEMVSRPWETNNIYSIINHSIKWWHHRKSSAHWKNAFAACVGQTFDMFINHFWTDRFPCESKHADSFKIVILRINWFLTSHTLIAKPHN